MTQRKSGHHRMRHLKVSLVFDHVGDTDTLKPAIRSSNVQRVQNESGKTAQPLIAITSGVTGRGEGSCPFQIRQQAPLRVHAMVTRRLG